MIRVVAPIVIMAALWLWGWWQQGRADAALERAEAAESLVVGYREAAQMRAAQDANLARLRDDAAAIDHDLNTMEGGDAPLSGYLSDTAGKLWP